MSLKRTIAGILSLLFITSCYKLKGPEKPKDLISKDRMVNILIDIRLLASATGANKVILENNGVDFKTYIYEKHNIDSLQFAKSNEYYAYNVDEYDDIYTKVKDSMEALKRRYSELEEQEELEQIKQDSIRAVKKLESSKITKEFDSINKFSESDSLANELQLKAKRLIKPVSDTEFPDQ